MALEAGRASSMMRGHSPHWFPVAAPIDVQA
jgi:hypothetical protein